MQDLRQLATNGLTGLLSNAINNLNKIVSEDLSKGLPKVGQSTSKLLQSPSTEDTKDRSSATISHRTSASAALNLLKVRKYIMNSKDAGKGKIALTPTVIQQIISSAIATKNLGLIRLVVCEWSDKLDFRTLEQYAESPSPSASVVQPFFNSPDEYDWFSRDRLGSIIDMNDACEIFSVLGMSQCTPNLRELYINARRKEYWAVPPDMMELTAITLLEMNRITTLVLRGMCDDYLLKIIGQSAKSLKTLDIMGSQFVTDVGIKNLFFKTVTENPASYLLKSFMDKNLNKMNGLVNTLEVLDYSYTNVTGMGRKMLSLLPGAFMFKRIFSPKEDNSFGPHVFLRQKVLGELKIPAAIRDGDDSDEPTSSRTTFKKSLEKFVTGKCVSTFLRLSDQHLWQNCILCLFNSQPPNNNSEKAKLDCGINGIVVANDEARRVYGTVKFENQVVEEIYSIFPVNLNILGEACPKLKSFRGIFTDTWKMKSSVFAEMTILDMFADPLTTRSILEFAPNLRKVRIRIVRQVLEDEHFRNAHTFMCSRTLEELWIAPGTYKKETDKEEVPRSADDAEWQSFNEVRDNYYEAENLPRNVKNNNDKVSSSDQLNVQNKNDDDSTECMIEDLVQLSPTCIRKLIDGCQKLTRLGDVAWWTQVQEKDVEVIYTELRKNKREIRFIWENKILPNVN